MTVTAVRKDPHRLTMTIEAEFKRLEEAWLAARTVTAASDIVT